MRTIDSADAAGAAPMMLSGRFGSSFAAIGGAIDSSPPRMSKRSIAPPGVDFAEPPHAATNTMASFIIDQTIRDRRGRALSVAAAHSRVRLEITPIDDERHVDVVADRRARRGSVPIF